MVDDRIVVGFNPNQLSQALQLGIEVAAREPAETIPLLGRVLKGVYRAVRQMPDDKLEWRAPDRDRPMREFAYHIFTVVLTTFQGLADGEYPPRGDSAASSYNSFRDIADYGGKVIEEYSSWAARQDVVALGTLGPRGSDDRSAAERLDLVSGHTVQHLRQLYFVLEGFGITPEDRIPDSEFPPEYVLTILW